MVPELHFNEKLQSYSIDSVTGEVTARFESGRMEKGFLLIGADGVHSTVRKLMYQPKDVFNARSLFPSAPEPPLRHMASHAGACVIYGVTKLHVPPVDMPDVFENGKPIEDLTRNDVHNFCPDVSRELLIINFILTHTSCPSPFLKKPTGPGCLCS